MSENEPKAPRIASDYTTRHNYMAEYRKRNREAINARKRAWRKEARAPRMESSIKK